MDENDILRFSQFRVDFRSGSLLRGGKPLPLRAKTWAVLRELLRHPGQLLPKDHFFRTVWSDVAVTEDTLLKSIGELRTALGDNPRRPRFIETVHRRGLRFVARVEVEPQTGPRADSHALRIEAPVPPPIPHFVGRREELGFLQSAWRRAQAGQRQVVFVAGEAGIGKTALIETFFAGLMKRGGASSASPRATIGFSIEQRGAREGYLPLFTVLESLARDKSDPAILPLLHRYAPSWLARIPWLLEPVDGTERSQPLDPVRGERMQRELCAFLEAASEERPLCMVLEDLHWADESTLETLLLLAQRRHPARLLVVATLRQGEALSDALLPRIRQALRQGRHSQELTLTGLSPREIHAYLVGRLGTEDIPELVDVLHQRTDGSPLFLTALLDDLMGRGWLLDTDPGWALSVPLAKVARCVPDSLREILGSVLDGLEDTDRRLLDVASVLDSQLSPERLAMIMNEDVERIERALGRLSRSNRLLRALPGADGDRAGRYAFAHSLHRQVVYESLTEGARRRWHRRAGEALESAQEQIAEELAGELATHFERAGELRQAIRYLSESATRDVRHSAPPEAIAKLRRALALAERLRDPRERDTQGLALNVQLGSVLAAFEGYTPDATHAVFERALSLSEKVGDACAQNDALHGLWHSQSARSDFAAIGTAQRLVGIAASLDSEELREEAQLILARTLFWRGRFVEADGLLEAGLPFWRRSTGTRAGTAQLEPPQIAVHWYSAVTNWFLGRPRLALERMETAGAMAAAVSAPFVAAGHAVHAAYLNHLLRNHEATRDLARRALDLSNEHGFPFWSGMAQALVGWSRHQDGKPKEALDLLDAGLRRHRSGGAVVLTSHILAWIAAIHLESGDPTTGLAAIDEALDIAQSGCDRIYEPELWRLKSELLLRLARRRAKPTRKTSTPKESSLRLQAKECLLLGLARARSDHARALELRVTLSALRSWKEDPQVVGEIDIPTLLTAYADADVSPEIAEARALLDAGAERFQGSP